MARQASGPSLCQRPSTKFRRSPRDRVAACQAFFPARPFLPVESRGILFSRMSPGLIPLAEKIEAWRSDARPEKDERLAQLLRP